MSRFEPIAIVGGACLLPGAHSPAELWAHVAAGRDLVGRAPADRWRVDRARIACAPTDAPAATRDKTWSDRGGYVEGFETRFDPSGFAIDGELISSLDPLFQWLLHVGRDALVSAGFGPLDLRSGSGRGGPRARIGAILGNLSFPSATLNALAERHWLRAAGVDERRLEALFGAAISPLNRFTSGLPAQLLARGLGLGGEAFALDAACASSLYAIKLACDRLHDRSADVMLAGGVNKTDDLFIHVGFCALQAMSKTGQSRPFHRDADGLVPAEGAALVVLKRLDDAIAARDSIRGVIRAVGLSNDGRGAGILAPSRDGQLRAMRRAYDGCGVRPSDVSLFECHATGTSVGDATEIESLAALLRDDGARDAAPIGSLKSNLGHLITAAGAAGLLKVLSAMKAGVRPPSLHASELNSALENQPLRVVREAEAWASDRPKLAAVSAFGFGGNNAHAIVEEWQGARSSWRSRPRATPPSPIAIVAVSVVAAGIDDAESFFGAIACGAHPPSHALDAVSLDPRAARFPPRDLQQALPQQLLVLRAASDAAAKVKVLPAATTSVVVGMGCDVEIARYGARWRGAETSRALGGDDAWTRAAEDAFVPPLEAAGVIGTMPNIPANRINSALDLHGPSFTVSAEEQSGIVALQIAARALRAGEIDAAIVAAVDVSCEPVHLASAREILDESRAATPGDAAVALVLKRLDDAVRDGDEVVATIAARDLGPGEDQRWELDETASGLTSVTGHAHAASGLLLVAAAALGLQRRVLMPAAAVTGERDPSPWLPNPRPRAAQVDVASRYAQSASVTLLDDPAVTARPMLLGEAPKIDCYSGTDRADVLRALAAGEPREGGPACLTIVSRDAAELEQRTAHALARLAEPTARGVIAPGCVFYERPVVQERDAREGVGEVAFVFTGAASAYPTMGRGLALAFPDAISRLEKRFHRIRDAAAWIYRDAPQGVSPVDKLWGTSFLSQLHADLLEHVLQIRPDVAIGVSSGETNALFALGAFTDLDAMHADVDASGLYTTALGGDFGSVRAAWRSPEGTPIRWENWRIVAPLANVRAAVADEPRCHMTIVNAADDCVIGGDAEACARVIDRVGRERARSIGYDLAIHCGEVEAWRREWHALHRRAVTPVAGVRFYTHATGSHYALSSDAVADALTGQAVKTIDFPALIEGAYRDGVRVFIEIGPQSGCSRWIEQTLGRDRPHAAIALDFLGEASVDRFVFAAAHLLAAGVKIDRAALEARLAMPSRPQPNPREMKFPMHREQPRLPPLPASASAQSKSESPKREAVVSESHSASGDRVNGANGAKTSNGHAVQRMTPAPALPPITKQPRFAPAPSSLSGPLPYAMGVGVTAEIGVRAPPQERRSPPELNVAQALHVPPSPRLPAGEGEARGVRSARHLADLHSRVSDAHRTFLAQQAELHQRFLALRMVVPSAHEVTQVARPATSDPRPATSDPRPATSDPRPATSDPRPATSDPRPATSDPRPATSDPRPATSDPRPATSDPRPATSDPRPATSDPRPATSDPRPATSDPRPATSDPRPATSDPRPATSDPRPATSDPRPATSDPRPATSDPRPATSDPRPATSDPRPATSDPRPATSDPRPATSDPRPATSDPRPATSDPRPATSDPRPATSDPRPATAKPSISSIATPLSADPARAPIGPSFDRAQLEVLAGGKISAVLGPLFSIQDDFRRQVRMPMPPLLLADRVLGIDATAGEAGKGTLWTETDVAWDSWYLHDGRIPAGVMIEAGQADLLLISWMGADFLNRGERVYRLLGCDLTYHLDDGLPRAGQTLRYDIHVDGHAQHGDVRIFFFHYDCRVHPTGGTGAIGSPESGVPVLSVRHGQAGFFTDEELAGSGGILWTPETGERAAEPRVSPPPVATVKRAFSRDEVRAFTEGRVRACFGDTHAIAETHVRTPRIGRDRLDFLGEITHCEIDGGPWKRGYLRAVTPVTPNDWFFDGHFKDDPCMPGTLMFEGCQQAMAFYLAALGFTLDNDGWRFEPVPEETYKLRCRGQVTPKARELVYEVFVDELIADADGHGPTLFADILCTVDGLKAFHCRRMGIRLTPDFPWTSRRELVEAKADARPCASVLEPDGVTRFAFDQASLVACAWGNPSAGFGRRFEIFDGPRRTPRLPGPPYHFMSRVTKIDGELFQVKAGTAIEVEYDLPRNAWYFDATAGNGHDGTMPYAVILEAALQPCGWLASATSVTTEEPNDVAFRNLDGTCTWHRELRASDAALGRRLVTRTKLTSLSRASGMVIVGFEVASTIDVDGTIEPVFTMKTVFGFFPKEALASQAGLSTTDADRKWLEAASNVHVDLKGEPAAYFKAAPKMSGGMIRLLDRITGDWPNADGTGRMRAEKDIAQSEWFFKAHFFQDPVQPGSLGIEAMIEVLQAWVKLRDLAHGLTNPRFEPIAIAPPGEKLGTCTWKYRGQVLPHNKLVVTEAEITSVTRDAQSVTIVGNAWLWVDGMRIYACLGLAIRVVGDAPAPTDERQGASQAATSEVPRGDATVPTHASAPPEHEATVLAERPAISEGRESTQQFSSASPPGRVTAQPPLIVSPPGRVTAQSFPSAIPEANRPGDARGDDGDGDEGAEGPATEVARVLPPVARSAAPRPNAPSVPSAFSPVPPTVGRTLTPTPSAVRAVVHSGAPIEETIDPAVDTWVLDHCPTYTVPALPFMALVDRMAAAVRGLQPELRISRLRDVQVHRWVAFPPLATGGFGPIRLQTVVSPPHNGECEVTISMWREAKNAQLSRFERVASGRVKLSRAFESPLAMTRVEAPHSAPNPYETGLFHGPAFQRVRTLRRGTGVSVVTIDATAGVGRANVPTGVLAPLILDAALHGIPHDALSTWHGAIPADVVGYPWRLEELTVHAPTPTRGTVTATARFDRLMPPGADGEPACARVLVQIAHEGRVWVDITLVEVLLPKGPLGLVSAAERRAFLADRVYVPGLSLSHHDGDETRLRDADVRGSDWLPGTLATAYDLARHPAALDATTQIAIAEHVARAVGCHPADVQIVDDGRAAVTPHEPFSRRPIDAVRVDGTVVVRDAGPSTLETTRARRYWADTLGVERWLIGDLYFGLLDRFVGRVVVHDPTALAALRGRGAILLGNHQVGIESVLFSVLASTLLDGPVATLAKEQHRQSWIGELIALGERYPGVTTPESIVFFDRKDERALLAIVKQLGERLTAGGSVMVHVEGTRALSARQTVRKMTSIWLDLSVQTGAPIVPVRFIGGLPIEPLSERIDFPIGYGAQEIHIGAPIDPERLRAMPLLERTRAVLDAINALGVAAEDEAPCAPNTALATAVEGAMRRGMTEERAVMLRTLEMTRSPSEETATALSEILGPRSNPTTARDPRAQWLADAIAWLKGPPRP